MAQAQKFLVHLDLNGNQLRNLVLGTTAGTANGAVWFDSLAGAVKFIDGDGVTQTVPALSAVEADLADLSTLVTTEVSRLEDLISAETAAREAADSALDVRVTSVEGDVADHEARIVVLEGEVVELASDLADETAAREAADVALDGRVSTLETTVENLDGNYATDEEVTAAVAAEAALREAADLVLQGNIDDVASDLADEVAARAAADTALQTEIDAVESDLADEVAARAAADLVLQGNIDAVASDLADEVAAREAADLILQGNIDEVAGDLADEVARATAAEAALDLRIDDLETASGTFATVTELDAAIASEATRADAYADAAALAAENNAKAHAEALAQGLNVKEAVRARVDLYAGSEEEEIPADELPLAGDTVDGVLLAAGDRIIVNSYNPAVDSGLYVVGATSTVYADDWANDTNTTGSYVLVVEGELFAGTSWVFNTNDDNEFSFGDWKQFAGQFNYEAAPGISLIGRTIGIEPESLSSVHAFPRQVVVTVGDDVETSFVIPVAMTKNVTVTVREVATGDIVIAGVSSVDGSVTVSFATAPAVDEFEVTILGLSNV